MKQYVCTYILAVLSPLTVAALLFISGLAAEDPCLPKAWRVSAISPDNGLELRQYTVANFGDKSASDVTLELGLAPGKKVSFAKSRGLTVLDKEQSDRVDGEAVIAFLGRKDKRPLGPHSLFSLTAIWDKSQTNAWGGPIISDALLVGDKVEDIAASLHEIPSYKRQSLFMATILAAVTLVVLSISVILYFKRRVDDGIEDAFLQETRKDFENSILNAKDQYKKAILDRIATNQATSKPKPPQS